MLILQKFTSDLEFQSVIYQCLRQQSLSQHHSLHRAFTNLLTYETKFFKELGQYAQK